MSKKFLIDCDEATTICDKTQYKEASYWDKIKLSIHLLICKKCGLYSHQNEVISKVVHKHMHTHKEHQLSEEEKNILQKKVGKKMNE